VSRRMRRVTEEMTCRGGGAIRRVTVDGMSHGRFDESAQHALAVWRGRGDARIHEHERYSNEK